MPLRQRAWRADAPRAGRGQGTPLLVVYLICWASSVSAGEAAIVLCRVKTADGRPAPAAVHLRPRGAGTATSMDRVLAEPLTKRRAAMCAFPDIPPGRYELVVEASSAGPPLRRDLDVGVGERVLVEARLAFEGGGESTVRVRDRFRPSQATTFGARRLRELPFSRDPWSLLETAETNVIADRIDGGGLYLGQPSRVSTQGASWSQTAFVMGEMDVTDPEGTGVPLLRPDLEAFEAIDVATATLPPEAGSPGGLVNSLPPRPARALGDEPSSRLASLDE